MANGLSSGSSGAAYSGGGGGSLSSGSSGAAYSGSASGYSGGSSRSSGYSSAAADEEERRRRLLQQQQAAAAAQAGRAVPVVADTSNTAQAERALAASVSPPQAIDVNPLAQTITTPTPYGDIAVTRRVGAPTLQTGPLQAGTPVPQNPLAREGVFQAAEAYRNLPANATPEQRAQVMGNYQAAFVTKFGTPAQRAYDQQMGVREDRMAALEAQKLGPDATPEQQATAMAKFRANWRALTPEQQGAQYFGERGETWKQTPQKVAPLDQEAALQSQINEFAKEDRNLSAAVREAKFPRDEKGKLLKADREEVARLEEERRQHRLKSGYFDPKHLNADLNRSYATQVTRDKLLRGGASLVELARQQRAGTEQPKRKVTEAPRPSEQARQQLANQAEQARREREAWLDQLRQRTPTYYSHNV